MGFPLGAVGFSFHRNAGTCCISEVHILVYSLNRQVHVALKKNELAFIAVLKNITFICGLLAFY